MNAQNFLPENGHYRRPLKLSGSRALGGLRAFCLAASVGAASMLSAPSFAANHALIMTIGNYTDPEANLPGIDRDAKLAMQIARSMGVPPQNIVQVSDVGLSAGGIAAAFQKLTQRVQSGDGVFIYYSGHGGQVGGYAGRKCTEGLVTHDMKLFKDDDLEANLAKLSETAGRVVMMNDSCFSGGAATRGIGLAPTGPKAMTPKSWKMAPTAADASDYTCGQAVNLRPFRGAFEKPKPANLLYVAAASDNEVAFATPEGSSATRAWMSCMNASSDADNSGSLSGEEIQACAQKQLEDGKVRQTITVVGNARMPLTLARASDADLPAVVPPVTLTTPPAVAPTPALAATAVSVAPATIPTATISTAPTIALAPATAPARPPAPAPVSTSSPAPQAAPIPAPPTIASAPAAAPARPPAQASVSTPSLAPRPAPAPAQVPSPAVAPLPAPVATAPPAAAGTAPPRPTASVVANTATTATTTASAPAPVPTPVAAPVTVPVAAPPSPPPAAPVRPLANAAAALGDIRYAASGAISVKLVPQKNEMKIGVDRIDFAVTTSKAGYLYVLHVGSDGKTFDLLFPNANDADNKVAAGTINLPREGWRVRAGGPVGTSYLLAVVSDTPRDFAAGLGDRAGPFAQAPASRLASRNLVVEAVGASGAKPGFYGASDVVSILEVK